MLGHVTNFLQQLQKFKHVSSLISQKHSFERAGGPQVRHFHYLFDALCILMFGLFFYAFCKIVARIWYPFGSPGGYIFNNETDSED